MSPYKRTTLKRSCSMKKTHRTWCACEKLMVIHYLECVNNVRGTAKRFGIEPKQVRKWRSKKKELFDAAPYVLTLNRGRQAQYPLLEERHVEWVMELHDRQNAIT